jgi:FkbM family methyltransferase
MFNFFRKFIWNISSRIIHFRGKERIVAFLSRPKIFNQITIKRQGVIWSLQGHDLNEFYIAIRSNHSSILSNRLIEEIEKHKINIFWDIGANIGAISMPLLKKFNNLEAVLFEPSAEVAGRLIRNLAHNPDLYSRVTILTIALSDSEGINNFHVSNETFNSGVSGLGYSENRYKFAVGVQTYTGDSLVESKKFAPPQLIKIDVEGYELEVFKGLKNTLSKYHPIIIFEHSVYRLKERNQPIDTVTKFLETLGYSVYSQLSNKKIIENDLDSDSDFIARVNH